jgi:hypothetical protein
MTKRQTSSFSEVTFIEAAARRARVDLVLAPVTPGGPTRLISYFLGLSGAERIALATPQTVKGKKVFIPVGWRLGLSFEFGCFWFQATTTVVEHSLFQRFAIRRVDALIVEQPPKLLSSPNRRDRPRQEADPAKPFLATIWSAQDVENTKHEPLEVGRLHDWSEAGLGVSLAKPLALGVGERAIIRLDRAVTEECIFVWATLRHCTSAEGGIWLAGFGDTRNVGPGEAVGLMKFMASAHD